MISLYVLQGANRGKRFNLDRGIYLIGRDSGCDIRLMDEEVSRRHARLVVRAEDVRLIDLGSSNGTYLNREKIDQSPLQSGDRILCGQTVFLFTTILEPVVKKHSDSSDTHLGDSNDETVAFLDSELAELGTDFFEDLLNGPTAPLADATDFLDSVTSRIPSNLPFQNGLETTPPSDDRTNQLLQDIVSLVFEWIPVDRVCLLIFDKQNETFKYQIIRYRVDELNQPRPKISRKIVDYVSSSLDGVHIQNATSGGSDAFQSSLISPGVHEALCVPIIARTASGVLYADRLNPTDDSSDDSSVSLNQDHLRLLMTIAFEAAVAIESSDFYQGKIRSETMMAIGQTLTVLSHHIKNILQSITGGKHLVEHGIENSQLETIEQGWSIVKRNQVNISNLVMDMLAYGTAKEPVFRANELNAVVEAALDVVKNESNASRINFEFSPNASLPPMMIDGDAIQSAISNVLRHCVESCRQNTSGNIFVQIMDKPGSAVIEINDDGRGLTDAEQSQLFTPFADTDIARIRGIGLAVAQKIAVQHGGQIEVISKIGHGSNFAISLPIQVAPPATVMMSPDSNSGN